MNDLFISIDYNDREFEEVQSFKAALKKIIIVRFVPNGFLLVLKGQSFGCIFL